MTARLSDPVAMVSGADVQAVSADHVVGTAVVAATAGGVGATLLRKFDASAKRKAEKRKKAGYTTLMEAANGNAPGVGGLQAWATPDLDKAGAKDWSSSPASAAGTKTSAPAKKKAGYTTLMEAANGEAPGVGGLQAWVTPGLDKAGAKDWSSPPAVAAGTKTSAPAKKKAGYTTLMEAANGEAPGVGGVQAWVTPGLDKAGAKDWSSSPASAVADDAKTS